MEVTEIRKRVSNCPLFADLDEKEVAFMASIAKVANYPAGHIVYQQGQLGDHLYLLTKGQVSLNRQYPLEAKRHAKVTVQVLRPGYRGRLMGCFYLLSGKPHEHMCSAVCDQPTEAVVFNGPELCHAMEDNLHLGYKMMQSLIQMLGKRLESSFGAMENI